MKAIRVHNTGAPDVMKLEDVPTPSPRPGEVLIKVAAAGINPVDTYIRSGNYPAGSWPYTPGMDAAGVVEAVGGGVTKVKPGDRVYAAGTLSGSYAEYTLCKESQTHPLPARINFSQGAGINVPCATAYRALFFKAKAQPGETVLIHGASGGVGTSAIQLAKAHGLRVVGTGGTEEGRELVTQQGADLVLDHHAENYLEHAVEQFTGGKGFDVILEMLADVNLDKDLDAVAKWGRIVVIGNRGRAEIDARKAMAKEASILGMVLMNASDAETASIHAALGAALNNGTLTPIVGKELPLADASKGHELVIQPGSYGKIILLP